MTQIVNEVTERITPVIDGLGYEIVDVTYKKEYGTPTLTVYIWKKGGVNLIDCENVNNALETLFEEFDFTSGEAYNLNISSSGLDRNIVSYDDFRRSLDTEIEIFTLADKKSQHGLLKAQSVDEITLLIKGKEKILKKADITLARPYISFK